MSEFRFVLLLLSSTEEGSRSVLRIEVEEEYDSKRKMEGEGEMQLGGSEDRGVFSIRRMWYVNRSSISIVGKSTSNGKKSGARWLSAFVYKLKMAELTYPHHVHHFTDRPKK